MVRYPFSGTKRCTAARVRDSQGKGVCRLGGREYAQNLLQNKGKHRPFFSPLTHLRWALASSRGKGPAQGAAAAAARDWWSSAVGPPSHMRPMPSAARLPSIIARCNRRRHGRRRHGGRRHDQHPRWTPLRLCPRNGEIGLDAAKLLSPTHPNLFALPGLLPLRESGRDPAVEPKSASLFLAAPLRPCLRGGGAGWVAVGRGAVCRANGAGPVKNAAALARRDCTARPRAPGVATGRFSGGRTIPAGRPCASRPGKHTGQGVLEPAGGGLDL